MNRSDKMYELLQEAFPKEGPQTGTDKRILHDASTVMKQAQAGIQQQGTVSEWRRIMRSPIVRSAAMIAVLIGGFWLYLQSSDRPNSKHTVLSLLSAATAAENAWFSGKKTVHIVNQIVIPPQHDIKDLSLLMQNLEAEFDGDNISAMLLRLLTPTGMEIPSLDHDGHRHVHHLELRNPQSGEAMVEDRIWYDPVTGKYARLLVQEDRVIFGHSFDGHRVYLARRDDQGELVLQSEPISASFTVPNKLAEFLGSTAGIRTSLEREDILIRGEPTESTIRGRAVLQYKLSPFELLDERIPYQELSVDQDDQSIVRIELIANQKPALIIDHLSRTHGVLPPAGWDLAALPESSDGPAPALTVRSDVSRTGLTVLDAAEQVTYPAWVFGINPYGTVHRTIGTIEDPSSPGDLGLCILYETQHGVSVALIQSLMIDRFVKAQSAALSRQGDDDKPFITTSHGFKAHSVNANNSGNAFILNLLFYGLDKKAADNRNLYLLESPGGAFMCLGVDGWLPSIELEQLLESLVLATDYEAQEESLAKTPVDLRLATHTDPQHDDYITRWLLLGPFDLDVDETDPNDAEGPKLAFDRNEVDLNTFAPEVSVHGQDYAWTSCYGDTIYLQGVYGVSAPGICYGRTRIIMSEQTHGTLGIGSSDAVKIWLNGELVHEAWGPRSFQDDSDLVRVTLRAGENHLVFKSLHTKGDYWRFSCRFKGGSK